MWERVITPAGDLDSDVNCGGNHSSELFLIYIVLNGRIRLSSLSL